MAKRKHDEAHENEERWLVTYADMITLLMVFFIVMFSMANTDLKKFETVAEALGNAFNVLGTSPGQSIIGDNRSAGSSRNGATPFSFGALPARQRDFVQVSTELAGAAQQLGLDSAIDVRMNMEGIIISLSDAMVFEPGSAELRPEALPVLDTVGNILKSTNNEVRVEGNTDDIPTNSPLYPTNWELSVARAVSIVRYLTEEVGIDPQRLSAAGNAEFNPMVPNDSRANRKINRRADIIMVYPTDSRQFSISLPPINKTGASGAEPTTTP